MIYPKDETETDNVILKNYYNVGLSDDNDNYILSPHFVDPENPDREKRDFSLKPSFRLLHKGSDALYDKLKVKETDGTMKIDKTTTDCPYQIYSLAYVLTLDVDAADRTRQVNTIDIGAYEYQSHLNRVLYVNPILPEDETKSGLSWKPEEVFGHGSLQNAINLAGLYAYANHEAYVFVKGGNESQRICTRTKRLSCATG